MSKELNCTNCSIGDFKAEHCDCDNGFCKEFKSIGTQEDFFNAVMQRIRPQGEWINQEQGAFYPVECSNCHKQPLFNEDEDYEYTKYCPYCGAKMKGADNE